jgi:branched-chain amino acid transport system substrate-binding protein
LKGLFAMKGNTLGGLAPPLTFTQQANEDTKIDCWFTISIANQQFTAPEGMKLSCGV